MNEAKAKVVMVIDDDAAVLNLMKAQLEVDGYTVLAHSDGAAAAEAAKGAELLAVLLDLHMGGGLDGFETLKRLKILKPRLPVIMVTGSHEEAEARKAFDLGAWDYVTKPIDFNYLKNILLLQSAE